MKAFILIIFLLILISCGQEDEEVTFNVSEGQVFRVQGFREIGSTNSFRPNVGTLDILVFANVTGLSPETNAVETETDRERIEMSFSGYRDLDGLNATSCNGKINYNLNPDSREEVDEEDIFGDYGPNQAAVDESQTGEGFITSSVYLGLISSQDNLGSGCTYSVYDDTRLNFKFFNNGVVIVSNEDRGIEVLARSLK